MEGSPAQRGSDDPGAVALSSRRRLAKQAVQASPRSGERQGGHKYTQRRREGAAFDRIHRMKRTASIVPLAVAFEGGLGLAAVGLAWWLDVPLAHRLRPSAGAALRGVIGLIPLL